MVRSADMEFIGAGRVIPVDCSCVRLLSSGRFRNVLVVGRGAGGLGGESCMLAVGGDVV